MTFKRSYTLKAEEICKNVKYVCKGEFKLKNTVLTLQQAKNENKKITMLTAYDYSTARLIDEAGVNMILVGDSRANAVKLEGGVEVKEQIKAIVAAGIPVVAHIGLTPQSVNAFGGHKVQGKTEAAAKKLIADALAVEEAGAFCVVIEGVPAKLAALITKKLTIPTIGIGAGAECDGQVLVYQDMLGMYSDFTPKFVKKFSNVGEVMKAAFEQYINEVQSGVFPSQEHCYAIDDEIIEKLK